MAFAQTQPSPGANAHPNDTAPESNWSLHYQLTTILQDHNDFKSPYAGPYSLQPKESPKLSLTTTLFIGRKLWRNGAAFVNAEIAGGSGLSGARGVAGFVNGETFRIGDPSPVLYLARGYVRQIIPLGQTLDPQADDVNQVPGQVPLRYLSINVGKYSVADFFDQNTYSHDPRTQFLNWSLMSTGAWDYPANTRGYTVGGVVELKWDAYTLRLASTLVPKEANGPILDKRYGKAHSETLELTHRHKLHGREGALRAFVAMTTAPMAVYADATYAHLTTLDGFGVDGARKYNFGVNAEQDFGHGLGGFFRASYNDGRTQTWAFTQIDRSVSLGVRQTGTRWHRPTDHLGIAAVVNGISAQHRAYLAQGGYGFIIGDGALNYAPEAITELYYSIGLPNQNTTISPDYQFVANPAYNKDRGPVHVFAVRLHVAF